MLKKYIEIKWNTEANKYFSEVNLSLTTAIVLISPDFTNDFMIFYFASEHTITTILLQKNSEGNEQPIAFLSIALRYA